MNTRHTIVDTVIGDITIVAADDSIVGLYFPHHWTKPSQETFGLPASRSDDALLEIAATQLIEYLAGERTAFDVRTAATGTEFEQRVWALLAQIPYGTTTTYGALADQLGDKNLAQLVGQAVGHNPLSIVVPCHRVVGKDGKLIGYAGGLQRKKFLLELEEPAMVSASRLF